MPKLTKRVVDAATSDDRLVLWDSDVPGFGLIVRSTGRKTWIARYRVGGGRAGRIRWYTIGPYPTIYPDEAREIARKVLTQAAEGADPAAERKRRRTEPTVGEILDSYLVYLEQHRKPSTAREARRLFERSIRPELGTMRCSAVTKADVIAMHRGASKRGKIEANRALTSLRAAWNRAIADEMIPQGPNPTQGVKRFGESSRQRYLSTEEIKRLGAVLARMDREVSEDGRRSFGVALAIRLMLLTGMRSSEVRNLWWSEIDFERKCANLRDSKTGPKVVPLSSAALELLANAPRTSNPHVCPGRRENAPLISIQKAWERIRAEAGIEDVTMHAMRHTFASVGATGHQLKAIGAILGHSDVETTDIYAHFADHAVREAVESIADTIAEALKPAERDPFKA